MAHLDETGSVTSSGVESPRRTPFAISSGAVASGAVHAPGLTTSGTRSTGAEDAPPQPGARRSPGPTVVSFKANHRLRALFSSAIENLERAIDTASDLVLRDNSLSQARDAIGDLWAERGSREEQFAEAVNMLQNVLLERSTSAFTTEQLSLVLAVLTRLRDEPVLDDDLLTEVTMQLLEGGIDVFRELD